MKKSSVCNSVLFSPVSIHEKQLITAKMDEIYSKITDDSEFGIEFDKNEKSDIQEFFANETVLLTGCTGFLGKCFVEKLLRGCPRLKKLYLTMRPYKEPVSERAKNYFQHVIFSKLRELMPNFESKVTFIEAHLMKENCGISPHEHSLILNEVTMIIHNASDVKFDTEVNKSLRTNVYGTLYLLNLAKECKNMKLFTYVSTGYSHSYQQHIEEKCYPPPGDLKFIQDFIDADESCPGSFTEKKRYEAVKPWPNIYTFSKATAESLIERAAKDVSFRCLIYRPTIVTSTWKAPIAAWCGNVNGPVAAVLGAAVGIIRILYKAQNPLDFVPADMCTNALLAIMWDSVVNRPEKNTVLVYNYGSSTVKPMNLFQLEKVALPRAYELPVSKRTLRPYYLTRTSSAYWYIICHIIMHWIPSIIGDIYFIIFRFQKPTYIFYSIKISQHLRRIWVFVNGNWRIHIHETRKMWNRMSEIDKHLFYNDLRTLDWEDYGYNYWAGIKQYILKEPNDERHSRHVKKYILLGKMHNFATAALTKASILIPLLLFIYWISPIFMPTVDLARSMCTLL